MTVMMKLHYIMVKMIITTQHLVLMIMVHANRSSNDKQNEQGAQDDRLVSGKDATIAGGAAGAGATGKASKEANKNLELVLARK